MSLIGLLVGLIILVIVFYAVKIVLGMFDLPQPVVQLIYLLLAVVGLVVLLGLLGFGPGAGIRVGL